ncbi:MAG: carboxypeptidase-like regulatory domain-containing protein [Hymenobacter sp.]
MTATRYFLLAISALLSQLAAAQGLVTGKVLDRQTRQPVPYASVVVAGTSLGTTSNAEGEFGLRVAQLPAKLLAFSLGYGRDSVMVTAAGPTPRWCWNPRPSPCRPWSWPATRRRC